MAEINNVYGSMYQNILDAGFDTHTAAQCMGIVKEERHFDSLPVLSSIGNLCWIPFIPDKGRLTVLIF